VEDRLVLERALAAGAPSTPDAVTALGVLHPVVLSLVPATAPTAWFEREVLLAPGEGLQLRKAPNELVYSIARGAESSTRIGVASEQIHVGVGGTCGRALPF
jgi:hypothetical protein